MNTLLLLLAPWANIDGQQVSKEIQSNTISSNGIWMFMKGLTNQRNLIKELLDFPQGAVQCERPSYVVGLVRIQFQFHK